ncbi:hypothetical protein MJN51_35810, partial [Salmonella enterica subsp. enterica serovar Kentucky]|nr:hypothetical protein [Salmonella enterica subsp. enterica serovar Kentucky]
GVTGDYYRISATYHIKRSVRVFLIILCCLLPGGVFAGSLINAATLDSVVRARKVFGESRITIISQAFHNQRAIWLAQQYGIDAIG